MKIELCGVKINEKIIKMDYDPLYSLLSLEETQKIKRLIKKEDAIRSLIAIVLLKWRISRIIKKSIKDIIFDTDRHGKPFLKNYKNINFNISHS
jgi:4'-phosphopantetheinyl transferase